MHVQPRDCVEGHDIVIARQKSYGRSPTAIELEIRAVGKSYGVISCRNGRFSVFNQNSYRRFRIQPGGDPRPLEDAPISRGKRGEKNYFSRKIHSCLQRTKSNLLQEKSRTKAEAPKVEQAKVKIRHPNSSPRFHLNLDNLNLANFFPTSLPSFPPCPSSPSHPSPLVIWHPSSAFSLSWIVRGNSTIGGLRWSLPAHRLLLDQDSDLRSSSTWLPLHVCAFCPVSFLRLLASEASISHGSNYCVFSRRQCDLGLSFLAIASN